MSLPAATVTDAVRAALAVVFAAGFAVAASCCAAATAAAIVVVAVVVVVVPTTAMAAAGMTVWTIDWVTWGNVSRTYQAETWVFNIQCRHAHTLFSIGHIGSITSLMLIKLIR